MSKQSFSGVIKQAEIGGGSTSKFKHRAIVLDTGDGKPMPLRLRGGNSFDYSPFRPFIGWRVEVQGEKIGGNQLMVDSPADITKKGGSWPRPNP